MPILEDKKNLNAMALELQGMSGRLGLIDYANSLEH